MTTFYYTVEKRDNILIYDTPAYHQQNIVYNHDRLFDTSNAITIRGAQDSVTNFYCIITNCSTADLTLELQLIGQGAQINVYGVYMLNANQRVHITTKQHHPVANTLSTLTFNGVLTDTAQVNYRGTIFVEKEARNVQAMQNNKTILLSKKAQVQSIPTLEVLNNDVQCAHGSAVGQLDEQQVWYAQTRGFSERLAQEMLIGSFVNVDDPYANQLVANKIKKMVNI